MALNICTERKKKKNMKSHMKGTFKGVLKPSMTLRSPMNKEKVLTKVTHGLVKFADTLEKLVSAKVENPMKITPMYRI